MINILSLLSFANAVFFMFIAVYSLAANRKSPINQASSLECFLLAIWTFSYTFFYIAPTKEAAWFWLKLASIGWGGFMGVLVWFFLAMARDKRNINKTLKVAVIGIAPAIIILLNLFSGRTSPAIDLVLSSSGLGWTYVNSVGNVLYWLYVAYIFTGALICIYILKSLMSRNQSRHFKRLAVAFISVDGFLLGFGFVLDLIIPLITDAVPPLTNVFLIIFSFSYWIIILKLEVFKKTSLEASEFILDTISDALMVLDREGRILHCNKATSELLQYEVHEIIGKKLIDFYKKGSFKPERLEQLNSEKKLVNMDAELAAKDGTLIQTIYSASVAEDDIYGFMGTIVSFHDVSKQKTLEKELYELAHYDSLTGLPNRHYFLEKLQAFEADYQKGGKDFAILFMDLNGFKMINDFMGHDKGDKLLIEIGERLSTCISVDDLIARIGGDEFVMLQANVEDVDQVEDRKAAILQQFDREILIETQKCPIGVSIGYALYSETNGISSMMREADQRMYVHKTARRYE